MLSIYRELSVLNGNFFFINFPKSPHLPTQAYFTYYIIFIQSILEQITKDFVITAIEKIQRLSMPS